METPAIRRAAVIGTGMMGPGIAATLARAGLEVTLISRTPAQAAHGVATAEALHALLVEQGLAPAVRGPIHPAAGLAAAAPADLVIESTPEDMQFKQALFAELDALCAPRALLTSNTSGLSITAVAARCTHPERVFTTHFWNPPHLMPLVEIVPGARSLPAHAETLRQLLAGCGKRPVILRQDRPGQLGNRLQMALVREAAYIVQEGIASAEDVDTAARCGFGLRLPVYGILEHQDMIGLELGRAVVDYVARDLNNNPCAPRIYAEKLAAGETGVGSGRGFYDWSRKDAARVRTLRDQFLIEALKSATVCEAQRPA